MKAAFMMKWCLSTIQSICDMILSDYQNQTNTRDMNLL